MKVQNFFMQENSASLFNDADRDLIDAIEYTSTTEIDAFRQGVEIRSHKQYIAGSVKILSGERGHTLTPQPFGQATNDNAVKFEKWTDKATFYPLEFIINGARDSFSINDNLNDATIYDGVIKFNSIIYDSIAAQRELKLIGTLVDGNTSQVNGGTTQIATVSATDNQNAGSAFNDAVDREATSASTIEIATVSPYLDSDNVCYNVFNKEFWPNQAPSGIDISVVDLIIRSNARQDSYVQSWQASATAGFQFNSNLGTDSIAFGDMQY